MINNIYSRVIIITILLVSYALSAEQDSVKTYKLDEVTVKSGFILKPKSVTEISYKEINRADASSVIEFSQYIPSVKAQTNSRGESQIFLRGSGERQISLFFDGAPLNIPWDNRIDLSLIPADAVGGITVTKGIPSIIYGANTLAGVVNITTKEYVENEKQGRMAIMFGENNSYNISGSWLGAEDNFSYLATVSYNNADGFRLPKSFDNHLANPSKYRINSYAKGINTFAKVKYSVSPFSNVGLSVSYIDSEKGVPPEIDVANPRYWQYPEWKKLTAVVNGQTDLSGENNFLIAYSLSFTKAASTIEQFTDNTYSAIDDIEKGEDFTYYGRINFQKLFSLNSIVRFSASGYTSTHFEKIKTSNFSELKYSQNVFSTGAEYEFVKNNYALIFGGSLDGSSTPNTGDKPAKKGVLDYSISSAFTYEVNENISLRANLGRKTRFPTLRESFSGALGRFLENPNLKAESAYSGELNFSHFTNGCTSYLNLFTTILYDGIVRQALPDRKFQRINKSTIRTIGIEYNSTFEPAAGLQTDLHFTYLNSAAKNTEGEFKDTLEYRPEFIGGVNISYTHSSKLNAAVEANYVGREFGLKEGSEYFQKMDDYFLINIRLAYKFEPSNNIELEGFIRLNNIFDKLYFTQFGLPEAGRQILGGLSASF